MPAATGVKAVKKLVLCFDGTGNTFSGTSGDTNIVKLYDKFNRDDPLQFHYYQSMMNFTPYLVEIRNG